MQHVTNTHFGKMLRRTTLCALTSFALLGSTALAPAFAAPDPLKSQAQIDQPTVLAGGTRVVYVAVSLEGIDVDPGKASPRPPLNVSLVLDRSGSMSDQGKIEYLRKASKLAVDRLNSQDTLSIVEYDDQITLMVPAKRVGNLSEVKAMIDALEPRGSTNLAGGMVRGAEEARGALNGPASGDGTITRVMLMSDGLANTGVTNPQEIAELVRKAKSGGVRISAMGLGREYDEDLMQAIAENGGGHYYYIENPSQMARIFQEELGTMLETCAKDIEIDFSGKSAVRKAELVGYDDAKGTQSLHRGVEDLYEGEKRSLLIRLEIAAPASGRLDLGSFSLKYKSAKSGQAATVTQALSVDVSTDKSVVDRNRNNAVAAEAALAESDRLQKEQVRLYQEGRHDEAQRNMAGIAKDLEEKNLTLKDERVKRKIEALNVENRQMGTATASPSAQQDYLKSSKQRLYQAKAGKRSGFSLQPGDKGLEVEQLQEALKKAGVYKGPIDGIYDEDVKIAVRAYQQAKNLSADGVAGATTMDAMGLY